MSITVLIATIFCLGMTALYIAALTGQQEERGRTPAGSSTSPRDARR